MSLTSAQLSKIRSARELFDPRSPVSDAELLAGRAAQTARLVEAIEDRAAHAIVYGDRGVGKTSVASCVQTTLATGHGGVKYIMPRVNCSTTDDFDYMWRKLFERIPSPQSGGAGLGPGGAVAKTVAQTLDLSQPLTPFTVEQILGDLKQASGAEIVPVFDEFDRLAQDEAIHSLADTMKGLSDSRSKATIVIVGVAQSVSELITHHGSLGRHLVEIRVPRLGFAELMQIVTKRLPTLEMEIEPNALGGLAVLSRGLPYYVHLLARSAAVHAISHDEKEIKVSMLIEIMNLAINESETELATAYYDATKSPRKDALHGKILAACALAKCDEFGYFRPGDVKEPLQRILGKECLSAVYNGHLSEFASDDRGHILERTGESRKKRYRFANPMIQPYVIMKSYALGILTIDQISGRPASA